MSDNFQAPRVEAEKQAVQNAQAQTDQRPQQSGRPNVTNTDAGTKDTAQTMKDVKAPGRSPEQIDQNIQSQTGRTALELAGKLGIETNKTKNPDWMGQVEAKATGAGLMRPPDVPKKENFNLSDVAQNDKVVKGILALAKSDQPGSNEARKGLQALANFLSDAKPTQKGSVDVSFNKNVLDKFVSNFDISDQVKVQFSDAIQSYIPKGNPYIADNRGTGTRETLSARDQKERIENFLSISTGTGHALSGFAAAAGLDTQGIKGAGQLGDMLEVAASAKAAAVVSRPGSDAGNKNSTRGREKVNQADVSRNTNQKESPSTGRPNVTNSDPPKANSNSENRAAPAATNDYSRQGPYSPKDTRRGYEKSEDKGTLTSTTVPPDNHPSLRRKAIDLPNGQSIGFDSRGLPDLSPYTVLAVRATPEKSPRSEMKEATRKLNDLIGPGNNSFNGTVFNADQMTAIRAGKQTIPGFTWHHTLGTELQLVPTYIHKAVIPHIGSSTLREGR